MTNQKEQKHMTRTESHWPTPWRMGEKKGDVESYNIAVMNKIKLYYHKTDGGAEYLTDTYIDTKMDKKTGKILSREGTFTNKTKYIVRIDGNLTKDVVLIIKKAGA